MATLDQKHSPAGTLYSLNTRSPYFKDQPQSPHIIFYIFAYFLLVGYFYSFAHYGLNLWDEGGYAYGAWRTWNGQTAMKDFNPIGYLPGRYVFGALLFQGFGVDLQSLRLGMVALTPLMVLLVFAIARRLMSTEFALLAAGMMLSAPSMYYNRFFPLFCVLNLFCLIKCIERPGATWRTILTAMILLTLPFKPEVALFSSLVSGVILGRYSFNPTPRKAGPAPRGLVWLSTGLLGLAGLGLLIYLVKYEVPQKFFEIVITTHEVWGNPMPSLFPLSEIWNTDGGHLMFERILFYLPLLVYTVIFGFWWVADFSNKRKEAAVLGAVLGFGVCAFGLVIWRAGFDNLLRTLPPFYILICFLLNWARVRLQKDAPVFHFKKTPFWDGRTLAIRALTLLLPLAFIFEMNIHHGFYAGSVGARLQGRTPLQTERINVLTNPTEAQWVTEVVDIIQRFSKKGDRVLALPLNPIFYFLSDRENSIVHDWILPGMLDQKDQEDVLVQLAEHPPQVVVFSDIPIDGREDRRFSNYAPVIYNYLQEHYALYQTIGLFDILLPRAEPKPSTPPIGPWEIAENEPVSVFLKNSEDPPPDPH